MHKTRYGWLLWLLLTLAKPAEASHITGGEMFYSLVSHTGNMYVYEVTLKLYQRCNSGRNFPNPTYVSVFERGTNTRVTDLSVNISATDNLQLTNTNPCITNPPDVCFDVAYYTFTIQLPGSETGYTLSSQVNFRIAGISNLSPGYGNIGAIYSAEIPGTGLAADGPENHSAHFTGSDLVTMCANNPFSYSFSAEDADQDELRYTFCGAYNSTSGAGGTATPTAPPPFPQVPYYYGHFDESQPLGDQVTIDDHTGLITGIAPEAGVYVVTVCVMEIRNGVVIATQRKDIQIFIADCTIASASLQPDYYLCKNTFTYSFSNQSTSPLIVTNDWEFTDPAGTVFYTFSGNPVTVTFPAAGNYTVKLVINRNQSCSDSVTSTVHVFPGFKTDFTSTGICIGQPTHFNDASHSVYGTVNFYSWDFGELTTGLDVSGLPNDVYTYPNPGPKQVRYITGDNRGCRDTVYRTITIYVKPPVPLAFRDTLICIPDAVQLQASGGGVFSWTPNVNIVNANTATPTVNPVTTTTYYVTMVDQGCTGFDSVRVNVTDHVRLLPMPDTTVCRGDTLQIRMETNGLRFNWTPAANCVDPAVAEPFVFTQNPLENFRVLARIGSCSATAQVNVRTVPYPVARAGADTTLCYNTTAFLHGFSDGNRWSWSPVNYLSDASVLNPTATPPRTMDYVLTAFDNKGCPKPGRDTIRVTVLPKMIIRTTPDTSVVINQPLQLQASGGYQYAWTPSLYLSAANTATPRALFTSASTGIRFTVRALSAEGCADSANLLVKVFGTKPAVFVPTAFTPNQDGRNDDLRPIPAGIDHIEYFTIYNRWGQEIFTTRNPARGWDGKINGIMQATGTYVWMVRAVTYDGIIFSDKGLVTLIR